MKEAWKEWGRAILHAAWILLLLYYFCWPVRLMGSSMEPTLGDGEIVLMSRFSALLDRYEAGDLVLFRYEEEAGRQTLVKRIIGTAGDRLCIGAEGVELNGALLQEDYTQGETYGIADLVIPEGAVYVLGDNREASYDSRNIGAIAEKDLTGKVYFRIYPFSGFGRIS